LPQLHGQVTGKLARPEHAIRRHHRNAGFIRGDAEESPQTTQITLIRLEKRPLTRSMPPPFSLETAVGMNREPHEPREKEAQNSFRAAENSSPARLTTGFSQPLARSRISRISRFELPDLDTVIETSS
jgi:hypothetical protein